MTMTRTWSESTPAGTEAANTLDTIIQNLKTDIRERVAVNHDVTSDDTPATKLGGHTVVDLCVQTSVSNTANIGKLYAKDVSAKVELHWQDEDGNVIILTTGGKLRMDVNCVVDDAVNFEFNGTTGTKLGTATTQKLGFWNATPVVQQSHIANAAGGGTVDAEARTAIASINALCATLGLTAAS